MLVCIQVMVFSFILCNVVSVGDAGLIKCANFCTCRSIPLGSSREDTALSVMFLWCRAWIILKYCLAFSRVGASGAMYWVCVGGGGGGGRVD